MNPAWVLSWAVAISAPGAEGPERRVAVTSQLVLKVPNERDAADAIVDRAELAGGYLFALDESSVRVKVPTARLDGLQTDIETLGTVIGRNYRATDVGERIDRLTTRLASRRKVLGQYFLVLAEAGPQAVVSVERQITQLVREVESLEGQLRSLKRQMAFAELRIDFRAVERRPPAPIAESPFDWINSLGLGPLYGSFAGAR